MLGVNIEGSLQHLLPIVCVTHAHLEPGLMLGPGVVTTLEALLAPVAKPMTEIVSLGMLPVNICLKNNHLEKLTSLGR